LWRTIFGASPDVLGRNIILKGETYTIVGVLPEAAITPLNADIYTPLQPSRQGEGGGTNFSAIVRLRNGATWQEADAEINRRWYRRVEDFQQADPGAKLTYYSVPLQRAETDTVRPQALALFLAAGFILFIACANLAGLTLVRMLRRRSEVATDSWPWEQHDSGFKDSSGLKTSYWQSWAE
jgi:macrolide transport system ATP-binding/permease protein